MDDNVKRYIDATNEIYIEFGKQLALGDARLASLEAQVASISATLSELGAIIKANAELVNREIDERMKLLAEDRQARIQAEKEEREGRNETKRFFLSTIGHPATIIVTVIAMSIAKSCGVEDIVGGMWRNGK